MLFLRIVGWQYDVYKDEMTQEVCNLFGVEHGALCLTVVQDSRVGSWGGTILN